MTAILERRPETEEAEELRFPLDLGEWVARETVLKWTMEIIDALDWANPELVEHLKTHPKYHPKALLTAMSYAYLTGVFEAEMLAERCVTDPVFREICGDYQPSKQSIVRFRKDNRGLFKWVLAEVFKQALKEKYALGDTMLPAGLRHYFVETAVERLELARHMDR
jgi:transposase